ncbi:glycosyltransferase family 2 protein [Stieleria varia]|uniref:Putative glycosyltransferase EpsJ n=1 Tax=Stieleria varia TaxID=2528005 RepID=A0A5C6B367_9BACT|nr:glycosyltransferase family 2 protein [Stieleria varia]TWU05952.1 putative glycosyltransferase EpsJ [Stieleria varia]
MPADGLVSTIIPVFNRADRVRAAVDSVLSQTYRPIEIILVDDGSTDTTSSVLAELHRQHSEIIRVITQSNSGPGAARNTGLAIAQGEFIQYLDSDDVLHPEKFSKQVQSLTENTDAGVSYCITLRQDPRTNRWVSWAKTAESIENIFPSFLPKRGWATLTPLWRRAVCDAIGPWKSYRVMEDWEHDLRAGLLGTRVTRVDQELCTVVDHNEDRASGMNAGFTRDRTLYFFQAHESIWSLMKQHGKTDWTYVEPLSRTLFWIARMCGERGLVQEAEAALNISDEMMILNGRQPATKRFRQIKSVLGWWLTVKLGEALRR